MDKKLLDKLSGFNLSMQQKKQLIELIQEAGGGNSNASSDNSTDFKDSGMYIRRNEDDNEIYFNYFVGDGYIEGTISNKSKTSDESVKPFIEFINYTFEIDKLREKLGDNYWDNIARLKIIEHFNNVIPKILFNGNNIRYSFVDRGEVWDSSICNSILIEQTDYRYATTKYRFVFEMNFKRLTCINGVGEDSEYEIIRYIPLV